MVLVIHNCNCKTCGGSWSPPSKDGEIVFGGCICNCRCHDLEGAEKQEFIKERERLRDLWKKV